MENKEKNQGQVLPSFKNRRSVLLHLKDAGFKISRAQFYKDCKKGLIRTNPDGSVLESEVRGYAGNLKRVDGSIEDLSDTQSIKGKREVEKLEEQIAKLRFERLKEEGKYIPKKDFEAELAARAVIFESGFRQLFNIRVREFIGLVGGNVAKSADLLEALNTALDEQLNSYATTNTFQVMFEGEDA